MKKLFLGLILLNVIYVWSGAVKFGAQSVDVYAIWLLKAKVMYLNQGYIPRFILDSPEFKSAHWQYPLLWPFSIYEIYKIWGFGEQKIYNLYPVFYILILMMAYKNTRSIKMTYVYSMMGPLLAQGGRFHAGNADILITLLGWLIINFRSKKWLVALLVMAASMIKTEGVFWSVFLWGTPWFWLAITPSIVWQLMINQIGLPSDFGLTWRVNLVSQIWGLFRGIVKELLNFHNWYIVWPIFFLSIKKHILWQPLLLMLTGFGFVYLFTNLDSYAYVTSSFDRVLLQLSPIWLMIWVT